MALSLLALAAWASSARVGPRSDFTADGLNTPSAVTLDIAREMAGAGTLHARLYFSAPGKLDASLAALPRHIDGLLDALDPTGLSTTRSRVRPDSLDESEYEALQVRGIRAFRATRATSTDQPGSQEGAAWASLELTFAGNSEVLSFQDARETEELEFRVAFALERLRQENLAPGSGEVRIGFASDLPRMSAAEDYEYQSKGSFAPREGDVFQLARAGLARAGFTIEHIDPRDPKIGQSADFEHDALIWLQPRRNTLPMLDALQAYLRKGGSAFLAAQHFRTQARQYRGADFDLVFWPQPQVPDVERFWLPEFGVNLVREVLFDKSSVTLPIDTRILGKGTELEFQPEPTRAPFLVRASATDFQSDSVIMRGVDDLALADPNWIRLDAELLAASGLTARVLFQGSAESWHADWQGGWLTDEMLGGPTLAPDDYSFEPNPALCVWIEGTFPQPKVLGVEPDGTPLPFLKVDSENLAPGRLLFVGNSSFLNDSSIAGPEFRGDAFLLNAAAKLALEKTGPHGVALAGLAGKRPQRRGFGLLTAKTRRSARLWVVFGGAGALAGILLLWRAMRTTRARNTAAQKPSPHTSSKTLKLDLRRAVAPVIAPILMAILGFGAGELFANSLAESRAGGLRLGRLIGPDIRAREVAAIRITQGPGSATETSWTWVHGTFGGGPGYDPQTDNRPEARVDLSGDPSGSWREITGAGALGDIAAIDATIAAIFDAEGIVAHSGLTGAEAFGFNSATTWRIEVFDYQTEPDHTKWSEALAIVDIGTTSSDGLSAYLRAAGDPAIWSADTNPSARFTSR
ncbi:MAG: Gldg family protein, partial [Planctomycetota bacterium]|nr:Gldg family protein [Planctomycetota bacterium]